MIHLNSGLATVSSHSPYGLEIRQLSLHGLNSTSPVNRSTTTGGGVKIVLITDN